MKFDITGAVNAKETGKFLSAGIKNATFEGIDFENKEGKDGNPYQAMIVKFNIDGYGEYTQKFFEPKSDERKDNAWGGKNASQADDFLILIREILQALSPELLEEVGSGEIKLRGKGNFNGNFKQIVLAMIEVTAGYKGQELQIKLLPQSNGYAAMPTFIAKITKNGELAIGTWVIGHDLTLNDFEKKKIDAAINARPTNMANNTIVQDMKDDLDSDDDSDLPF